jgi:hypothetical protein
LKGLTAIAGAGTMGNDDYEFLRELSDDIGARVTGSPEAANDRLGRREDESDRT